MIYLNLLNLGLLNLMSIMLFMVADHIFFSLNHIFWLALNLHLIGCIHNLGLIFNKMMPLLMGLLFMVVCGFNILCEVLALDLFRSCSLLLMLFLIMNLLGVPFALRNNTGMTVLIVVLILIIGFGMDIMLLIGRHFAVIVKIYKLWMNIYFDYF